MLARFLDWLDEAAGGLIRVTYLLAGITAVAVYFGAGHLPVIIETPLNAALPWLLGFSLETHTYLSARRVRAAYQERNRGALTVHLGVLAGLLAFSSWNQLQYLSLTWQPPATGALGLPTWLAYTVRALIVPAAFMAAAFLAPLAEPVTAQIEAEARATLADVFRIARKQRRRLLKRAEAEGRDMTAALVELVPDPDVRRIIGHAYGMIGAPVTSTDIESGSSSLLLALPTATSTGSGGAATGEEMQTQPAVGPNTPAHVRYNASKRRSGLGNRPRIVRLHTPAEQ